jgi:non-specific serine/threonine protein kinase
VGREQALHDIVRLLCRGRLLTLTGPGGIGKTRLALKAAEGPLPECLDEIGVVELAGVRDPSLVPSIVAAALGMSEERGTPILVTLAERLGARRVCLVLDGCDHVLAGCIALVEALVRTCPDLRILATSREHFGIAGETVVIVPPFSLPRAEEPPSADRYVRYDAVRLFVERMHSVTPGFELRDENAALLAQICRRLDGIPLALELASARARVLSLEQILQRLDDPFRLLTTRDPIAHPRQKSLAATLDWSYDLLSETEKVLFRRLTVFSGSFTLEAVETICTDEELSPDAVLDVLSRLVEKSLIVAHTNGTAARYSMLGTIRAYGQTHLRRRGEMDTLGHRHQVWFLNFPQRGREGDRTAWLDGVERELENLRASFQWSLEQHDVQSAHRLAVALTPLWCARGFLAEARRWFERVHAHDRELPEEMKAESLLQLGLDAAKQGEHDFARALLEQSLDLFRDRADQRGVARATNALGVNAIGQRNYARAASHFEECLAVARQLGDHARAASTLNNLGLVALQEGDDGRAASLLEQAVALAREHGNTQGMAAALANLGAVAAHSGKHTEARERLEESLTLYVDHGLRGGVAECLEGLAAVAAAEGHVERAGRLIGATDSLRAAIGVPVDPGDSPFFERLTPLRRQCTEPPLAAEYLTGQTIDLEEALAYARAGALPLAGTPDALAERWAPAVGETAPALRIQSLGPVEVQRDGQALVWADWTYSKARELLVFLLNHPSRSKEQIGVALWPDISPVQLRGTFRTTLYHLRRTLGRRDWIHFTGDGYAFNRSLDYWYDVETFEEALAEAARYQATSPVRAMAALQRAIDLYRGPFLEDLSDGQWYLLRREQLGRSFLEALLLFGQLAFDQESYQQAVETYHRAIRMDAYLEIAHRQLMRCYQALGERAQALRHYEALSSRFRDELGISPDAETIALAARLRAGKDLPTV